MPESLGRLRRVRRIGAGGFASVWLYRDEQLDSFVAVKALADNWAQQIDVRERFLEEARVLRRAASDHVVEVHDFGETEDGTPYFVMTYADRGTVADLLHGGPAAAATTVDLIEQACRGVADLHAAGVVHRDIKPPNLLLRSDRSRGQRLLVADLGLAKALMYASGLTQIVGTPAYMAPEQGIPGGGVDERADVHALGAVAYHLLTGHPMRDMAIADIGSAEAPTPPDQVATVPPGLSDVVLRAVRPDPAERWPSAPAFAAALREAVGGQPPMRFTPVAGGEDDRTASGTRIERPTDTKVAGPPPSAPPRTRRRTIVALLAAITLVAAAGLAWLAARGDDDPEDRSGPAGSESPSSETPGSPRTPDTGGPSGDVTPTLDPDVLPADRPYCRQVADAYGTLSGIEIRGEEWAQGIRAATDTIHATTQAAPADIIDEWRLIDEPFQELQRAQDRIGLTLEDIQEFSDTLSPNDPNVQQLEAAVEMFGNHLNALEGTRVGELIRSDAAVRCDTVLPSGPLS